MEKKEGRFTSSIEKSVTSGRPKTRRPTVREGKTIPGVKDSIPGERERNSTLGSVIYTGEYMFGRDFVT